MPKQSSSFTHIFLDEYQLHLLSLAYVNTNLFQKVVTFHTLAPLVSCYQYSTISQQILTLRVLRQHTIAFKIDSSLHTL